MDRWSRVLAAAVVAAAAVGVAAERLAGQTDYYNTDANRPVRIEDAYPTERYAFELQLAPFRLERGRGGIYTWEVAPELTYGLLPRTHVEVGFPLALQDSSDGDNAGLSAFHLTVLHNLNIETASLPAFGIATDVFVPVGGELAPDQAYPSAKLLVTRTFSFARFHINAQYTLGPGVDEGETLDEELSRWLAGIAVDKTFPLRSLLLIADAYLQQPLQDEEDLLWNVGAGVRYQLSPRLAIDTGVGARFGDETSVFFTFGTAYAFAVRSLIPIGQ